MEHLDKLREAAQLILTFTELHGAARPDAALTVGELLDEFLTAKARTGRSVRYLRQMRTAINRVLREQRGRAVATVTTRELEAALAARKVSPRTVKSYLSDVRTLLGFAVRRGYLARNAAAPIDAPRCPPKPPALHTPAEVRRILATARASHPAFCRTLAVRYFSGLRSAEAFRLSEAEIKGNYIEVTAAKSKTRRRRLVEITPNLRAWLAVGGELHTGRTSGLASRVAKLAGVAWPGNVPRHSFCSYHLAHFGNAGRTALEAGHSEQMLFAHYREIVTREAANEFWSIVPQPSRQAGRQARRRRRRAFTRGGWGVSCR